MLIGNLGVVGGIQNALVFDASGQLFSWGFQNSNLYRVNKATGIATQVA